VIKTRDTRRVRPLRLILEKKNGDEKTSKDGLRKINCFILDSDRLQKVWNGQHREQRVDRACAAG